MSGSQVGRRWYQRTRRKVFEAMRVILEGRMKVGLRQVAGVAGFGEQTEIGQLQLSHHLAHLPECGVAPAAQEQGIAKGGDKNCRSAGQNNDNEIAGASAGGHRVG